MLAFYALVVIELANNIASPFTLGSVTIAITLVHYTRVSRLPTPIRISTATKIFLRP